MSDNLIETIKREFGPEFRVVSMDDFGKEKVKKMKRDEVRPENTLVVTSICRDDILHKKNPFTEYFRRSDYGFFSLGGLMGFPSGGLPEMIAASHHVPEGEKRNIIIIYGPHIGLTEKGEFGKFHRRGQHHESSNCGAMVGFLNSYKESANAGKMHIVPKDALMSEFSYIQNKLLPHMKEVMKAENPIVEMTKITYDTIEQEILAIVEKARGEMHDMKVMPMGVVFVNGPNGKEYLCIKNKE